MARPDFPMPHRMTWTDATEAPALVGASFDAVRDLVKRLRSDNLDTSVRSREETRIMPEKSYDK